MEYIFSDDVEQYDIRVKLCHNLTLHALHDFEHLQSVLSLITSVTV